MDLRAPEREAPPRRLHAVLVTHRRPTALAAHLDALGEGRRRPDRLLVIDNAPLAENEAAVADAAARHGLDARWWPAPRNLGPAGGIAEGMRAVLGEADDEDLLLLLDDDDPPSSPTQVADLVALFDAVAADHPRLGGVGLTGARFDPRRGRVVRLADHLLVCTVWVDHIGGNQLPCYRVAAVRDTGTFDADLFFGFEELAYGRRLTARGWQLAVDGDAWYERRRGMGRDAASSAGRAGLGEPTLAVRRPLWREFYSTRNLVHLLRREGHDVAAARVAMTRVAKAAVAVARRPKRGGAPLRLATRAAADGWAGRLGRTVEPEAST